MSQASTAGSPLSLARFGLLDFRYEVGDLAGAADRDVDQLVPDAAGDRAFTAEPAPHRALVDAEVLGETRDPMLALAVKRHADLMKKLRAHALLISVQGS